MQATLFDLGSVKISESELGNGYTDDLGLQFPD